MSLAKSIILSLASFGAGVTLAGVQPPEPKPANSPGTRPAEPQFSTPVESISQKPLQLDLDQVYDEPLVRQSSRLSRSEGGSGDGVAALINLNGELCAKPLGAITRAHHLYEVTCIENTDGSGRVRYAFNAVTGSVRSLGRTK